MKRFFKILYIFLTGLAPILYGSGVYAQTTPENPLQFKEKSHNFGKFSVKDGAKQHSFEFTNSSSTPIVINNVISSCGCTKPVWPKEPIMPGKGGTIDVTYLNDQGAFPFEKTITVYTSASKKPILLRISGVVYDTEKSLKEMFPIELGPLGIIRNNLKLGQIVQGNSKSGNLSVANTSNRDIKVEFSNVSEGLSISLTPTTIKANDIAEISYIVNTAEHENWGKTVYSANFVCNGVKVAEPLKINTTIIDNFTELTKEQRAKAALPVANKSTANFDKVEIGTPIEALFELRNVGQDELKIHKADCNGLDFEVDYPKTVKAGEAFTIKVNIDTHSYMGEQVFAVTLVTNAPNRPLMNLFVLANIE